MGRAFSPEVTAEVRELLAPIMEQQTRAITAARILAAILHDPDHGVSEEIGYVDHQCRIAVNYADRLLRELEESPKRSSVPVLADMTPAVYKRLIADGWTPPAR